MFASQFPGTRSPEIVTQTNIDGAPLYKRVQVCKGCRYDGRPGRTPSAARFQGHRAAVGRHAGGLAARPHLTADDVYAAVSADIGTISQRSVYDAVGMLVDVGLLRRIQPAGSAARYEARVGDNHHHLICRACGRTVDVDCAVGAVPCLTAADDAGYVIDEAEVIYWGRCPGCREAAAGA